MFTETLPVDKKGKTTNEVSRFADSGPQTKNQRNFEQTWSIRRSWFWWDWWINCEHEFTKTFTFNISLQSTATTQNLEDPSYSIVLKELQLNPVLVPSKKAKNFRILRLKQLEENTNLQTFGTPETKNPRKF